MTVDRRNGRDMVSMLKQKYVKLYSGIETEKLVETTNKRGVPIVKALRRIAMISVRKLVSILKLRGHNFSYGTVINYRPLFIGVATEREKLECLCKICYNMRLLFDILMNHVEVMHQFATITQYLVSGASCKFSRSGYIALECITGQCDSCGGLINPPKYIFPDRMVKYYQFESTKTSTVKADGSIKNSSRTERVNYEGQIEEVKEKLDAAAKSYLIHRYDVEHDKFSWPKILSKASERNIVVTHRDYSENIQEKLKMEPQAMHFSKKSFTLHCTVIHNSDNAKENIYTYRFSDKQTRLVPNCVEMDIMEHFLANQSMPLKKT